MGVSILLDGVDAYIKEEDLKECSQKASQNQKKLWSCAPFILCVYFVRLMPQRLRL